MLYAGIYPFHYWNLGHSCISIVITMAIVTLVIYIGTKFETGTQMGWSFFLDLSHSIFRLSSHIRIRKKWEHPSKNAKTPIVSIWLVVWNMNFMTFHILRMSWSQLTNSIIFQRGWYTTNQVFVFMIEYEFLQRWWRFWHKWSEI